VDPVDQKLLHIARTELGYREKASGYTKYGNWVQLRKRGRRHRTAVELPAEVTPELLDEADTGTAVMPALTVEAAAQAEDREFWGKISALEEDDESAFWDSLHTVMASAQQSERAPAMAGR